jgi:hypothetical protein
MWIWMRYRGDLHALVVLLEVAGITLLAAEVWAAQELETIDQDISQLKPQIVPAAVNRWEETKIRTAAWRRRRLWAGAGLLISAALLGMFEAKEEVPPPADDEVKVGLRLHPGRRLPSFVPGSAELTPEMRSAICHYRATPAEWGSAVAIVVGRHDKTELSASTRAQFSSNASLAEQRGLRFRWHRRIRTFAGRGRQSAKCPSSSSTHHRDMSGAGFPVNNSQRTEARSSTCLRRRQGAFRAAVDQVVERRQRVRT